jgi:hypothetical protein
VHGRGGAGRGSKSATHADLQRTSDSSTDSPSFAVASTPLRYGTSGSAAAAANVCWYRPAGRGLETVAEVRWLHSRAACPTYTHTPHHMPHP